MKNRNAKRFTADDVIALTEYYLNDGIKDKSNRYIRVFLVENILDSSIIALVYNKLIKKSFVYKGGYYPDPIIDLDGESLRMRNDINNKMGDIINDR